MSMLTPAPGVFSMHSAERADDVPIDTVIIHSMYNPEAKNPLAIEACIAILDGFKVSAHYLISRRGKVVNLVPETRVAWHAGVARLPDGRTNVNQCSIGIELINFENVDFSTSQYRALNKLLHAILARHPIRYILGHEHVAQPEGRKRDPGARFDWNRCKAEIVKSHPRAIFPTS